MSKSTACDSGQVALWAAGDPLRAGEEHASESPTITSHVSVKLSLTKVPRLLIWKKKIFSINGAGTCKTMKLNPYFIPYKK